MIFALVSMPLFHSIMSHLDVVRPDCVEERGPAVARVTETVEEDHRGRLLDPRLEDHRL